MLKIPLQLKHVFTKLSSSFLLVLVLLLAIQENSFAQEKTKKLANAGFDTTAYHPIFIQSSDGLFKLNLGMYTQFRYNMNWLGNTPDTTDQFNRGYNLARTRIFLEGDLTEKFYYHFRININPTGKVELMIAYLQWNLNKKMKLRVGKQYMALGREDWILPQDLATMEFSAHDFTYAIWTSFGIQFNHAPNNYFRYWASVGNGSYGSRRAFPDKNDSDVMLAGRVEWNVLGTNWGVWDDMLGRRGRAFGILLGVGGASNQRFDKDALLTDSEKGTQLNVDLSVTGNGFQFFSQGSVTSLKYKNNVSPDVTVGGFYGTFGYWINKTVFPYIRYDFVGVGNVTSKTESYTSPGVGISYYPFNWSNRIRVTAEYNYLGATLNNTIVEADGQLGLVASPFGKQQSLRFQLQFGF